MASFVVTQFYTRLVKSADCYSVTAAALDAPHTANRGAAGTHSSEGTGSKRRRSAITIFASDLTRRRRCRFRFVGDEIKFQCNSAMNCLPTYSTRTRFFFFNFLFSKFLFQMSTVTPKRCCLTDKSKFAARFFFERFNWTRFDHGIKKKNEFISVRITRIYLIFRRECWTVRLLKRYCFLRGYVFFSITGYP